MENNTNEVNAVAVGVHQTFEAAVNAAIASARESVWVPLKDITVPRDARPHSPEDVESRANSMARDGQEQNALLSKEGDKLVLVYGHGRYLSAQKLGWEKLRCDIKEGLSETQKLLLILSENSEREDASPFFTAQLYNRIMESEKLSSEQLPDYLKKARATVYNYLSLLHLPEEVQAMSRRLDIGVSHWVEIAKLPTADQQMQMAQECAEKDYSVRELQARVKKVLNPAHPEAQAKEPKSVPDFQFKWKNRELVIKVRPFRTDQEGVSAYMEEFAQSFRNYVAAFPAPETDAQEVQAAA